LAKPPTHESPEQDLLRAFHCRKRDGFKEYQAEKTLAAEIVSKTLASSEI
jgi:hypothetical protein